jgi:hypothetical protein
MRGFRAGAGQASTEYVGVLALVAVVLAGAATAVAAPDLPRAVVRSLKLGLCLVGGDVCRARDAAARGLDPCVVAGEDRTSRTGMTMIIRAGGHRRYAIERRSDGSYVVTAFDGQDIGKDVVPHLKLGAGFRIGGDGRFGIGWASGKAWELPDRAALDALLARVPNRYDLANKLAELARVVPTPPVRYQRVDGGFTGELGLEVGDDTHSTRPSRATADLRAALGRRIGPDGTTWYFEVSGTAGGALAEALPGFDGAGAAQVVEWHTGRPPAIALRTSTLSDGRAVDRVARLRLDHPGDVEAVRRYALERLSPVGARVAAADLARRIAARGTVERLTYEQEREETGFDYELELGLAIGAEHTNTTIRRRLVDAEVVTAGRTARRVDCLGLDAA